MTLTLLPAVDVAGGQAVRLVQGAAGSQTSYGDPLQAALAWQAAGAQWIHLVAADVQQPRHAGGECAHPRYHQPVGGQRGPEVGGHLGVRADPRQRPLRRTQVPGTVVQHHDPWPASAHRC